MKKQSLIVLLGLATILPIALAAAPLPGGKYKLHQIADKNACFDVVGLRMKKCDKNDAYQGDCRKV